MRLQIYGNQMKLKHWLRQETIHKNMQKNIEWFDLLKKKYIYLIFFNNQSLWKFENKISFGIFSLNISIYKVIFFDKIHSLLNLIYMNSQNFLNTALTRFRMAASNDKVN